jgi:hypothetical protein
MCYKSAAQTRARWANASQADKEKEAISAKKKSAKKAKKK